MSILLDTHAFLWYAVDDARLSDRARQAIDDPDTEALISPGSYWEIAIKISLGKFASALPYEELWRRGMELGGFKVLPIELRHTAALVSLPFVHRDPFDRLLAVQALVENIPLVSRDAILDGYGVRRIW